MVFVEADRMYAVFLATLLLGIGMGMMQTVTFIYNIFFKITILYILYFNIYKKIK